MYGDKSCRYRCSFVVEAADTIIVPVGCSLVAAFAVVDWEGIRDPVDAVHTRCKVRWVRCSKSPNELVLVPPTDSSDLNRVDCQRKIR